MKEFWNEVFKHNTQFVMECWYGIQFEVIEDKDDLEGIEHQLIAISNGWTDR